MTKKGFEFVLKYPPCILPPFTENLNSERGINYMNFLWNTFLNSGNIEAYLGYKELQRTKEHKKGLSQNGGNKAKGSHIEGDKSR